MITGKKKTSIEEESEKVPIKIPISIDGGEAIAVALLQFMVNEDWYYVKKRQRWFHKDGRLLTNEELYKTFLDNVT